MSAKLPQFVFPDDGSLETVTAYERYEDMSPDGYLQMMVEDDGDVILVVYGTGLDQTEYHRVSLQFCTFGGGGQSATVRNALLHLIQAIQQDNAERPQHRG